jgi:hypothetical protein
MAGRMIRYAAILARAGGERSDAVAAGEGETMADEIEARG